jgi:hypothetical protein
MSAPHGPPAGPRHPSLLLGGAALALVAIAGSLWTPRADARIVILADSAGRPITFDVRAAGVNLEGYRAILDSAIHGDEIEDVTIRVVPRGRLWVECQADNVAACYSAPPGRRAVIAVPKDRPGAVRNALVHEYGHHLDGTYRHLRAAPDFDGLARWWSLRRMGTRVAARQVAWDYSLGWERSIAEIFAEDYAVTNSPGGPYDIPWLSRPGAALRQAITRDVLEPRGVIARKVGWGWMRTDRVRAVPVPAPGPARRFRAVTRVARGAGKRVVRMELACGGVVIATAAAMPARAGRLRARLPQGTCELRLSAPRKPALQSTIIALPR